ncbi:type II secretion system protein [Oscillatoria laete-virens NRMC-F 0139]|nr:type II secretion system protein [Oscillatoria laete-virens NRMC-F 0139]
MRLIQKGFTLSEVAISVAITAVASALVLTVGMTVIRGALQNQKETEAHYQLQASLQKIEMMLQSSKAPPTFENGSAFTVFEEDYIARAANSANAGTKMIQVGNFKKKGIKPGQKTINVAEIKKPVQNAADLNATSTTSNIQVQPGDVVHFDTSPAFSRVVKSVNNPNAAVRTMVFEEAFPVRVPAGTRIRVGKISRVAMINGELRLYHDPEKNEYEVLSRRLDSGESNVSSDGRNMIVTLQTTIPTFRGQKILRAEKKISFSPTPLFYSEFNTSSGGGLP